MFLSASQGILVIKEQIYKVNNIESLVAHLLTQELSLAKTQKLFHILMGLSPEES